MSEKVKSIYQDKINAADAKLKSLADQSKRLSTLRLVIFIVIAVVALMSLFGNYFSLWWVLVPVIAFIAVAVRHDSLIKAEARHQWVREFHADGIRRLAGEWVGSGIQRTDYVDDTHLFARDLDIFGEGSLFELMCTAQTASGEHQLANWLTSPATRETILARQQAVRELADDIQLREDISVAARRMRSLLSPSRLNEWALAASTMTDNQIRRYRVLFFSLGALAILAVISCFFTDFGLAILAGIGILEWIVGRVLRPALAPVLQGVEGPRRQLKVMSDILARFETQNVQAPLLSELKSSLFVHAHPASQATSQLGRLVDWLDQAKNQIFAPVAFLLMWNGHFALSIEKWRFEYGKHIPEWLDTVGKLEALCALGGFAFEHPDYCWPTISEGEPVYDGHALGHPLLPTTECIKNSISLSSTPRVWVVSGSNMSGKSTFLRVVGINAVLAMSGAPVFASALKMTPFAIGSTIRVLDSLQKGKSRFYAEISTLKKIVEQMDGEFPLLFLLDEIFHGTNSHDRTIGATAVIKELVEKGALGLVTTHDLALTKTADDLGERARNVHFDDMVLDGRLHFDYLLKDGPVTHSNALELMRSVGLNV
ncbi:MAG: DNA mismatch repair protein MutS [Deltaproteobacteria bacterium]|nr:DNA mismatch repair protein MutS [Deltaproteobacteria bacterium]